MKPISTLPNAAEVQSHYFGLINAPGTDQSTQHTRRTILSLGNESGEYVLFRHGDDLPTLQGPHQAFVVLSPEELDVAVKEFTGRKLTVIHESMPAPLDSTPATP